MIKIWTPSELPSESAVIILLTPFNYRFYLFYEWYRDIISVFFEKSRFSPVL
jgi:hypothetical protein